MSPLCVPPEALQWLGLLVCILGAFVVVGIAARILERWELMRYQREQAERPIYRDWSRP